MPEVRAGGTASLASRLLALAVLGIATQGAAAGERGHAGQPQVQKQREDAPAPGAASESFDAAAVNQVVTKTASGGIRRVVANESSDAKQIGLIRENLRAFAEAFGPATFSGPAAERGRVTPATATLAAAAPGDLSAQYLEIRGGGELRYFAASPALVAALHEWLDAPWPATPSDRRAAGDAPSPDTRR